jgi:cyclase
VGGGIETIDDVALLIRAGADKVSINSSAFRNPKLITQVAKQFGSQCVVIAIDTQFVKNEWIVYIDGGRTSTNVKAIDWALKAENYGAGEILLTSMYADGTKSGFSIEITREVSKSVNIPVIASGGAGTMDHFREVLAKTTCSAALAASIFHYGEISIPELKVYLAGKGINVRC